MSVRAREGSDTDIDQEEKSELRNEIHRIHRERLLHLEQRLDKIDEKVEFELERFEARLNDKLSDNSRRLTDLAQNVKSVLDNQTRREPAMEALESVIRSGIVMKWILVFIVSTLAAIATVPAAIEAIKRFMR